MYWGESKSPLRRNKRVSIETSFGMRLERVEENLWENQKKFYQKERLREN